MGVYRHFKGGQFGDGGDIINIAQAISDFAASLPRLGPDVPIPVVRREGPEDSGQTFFFVESTRGLRWTVPFLG